LFFILETGHRMPKNALMHNSSHACGKYLALGKAKLAAFFFTRMTTGKPRSDNCSHSWGKIHHSMDDATNYNAMIRGKPKLDISRGYGGNSTVTLRMKPALDYNAVIRI
jgi:hypothetical protein